MTLPLPKCWTFEGRPHSSFIPVVLCVCLLSQSLLLKASAYVSLYPRAATSGLIGLICLDAMAVSSVHLCFSTWLQLIWRWHAAGCSWVSWLFTSLQFRLHIIWECCFRGCLARILFVSRSPCLAPGGKLTCSRACSMRMHGVLSHQPSKSEGAGDAVASHSAAGKPPLSRRASHEGPLSQLRDSLPLPSPLLPTQSRHISFDGLSQLPSSSSRDGSQRTSLDGTRPSALKSSSEGSRRLSLQVCSRSYLSTPWLHR